MRLVWEQRHRREASGLNPDVRCASRAPVMCRGCVGLWEPRKSNVKTLMRLC